MAYCIYPIRIGLLIPVFVRIQVLMIYPVFPISFLRIYLYHFLNLFNNCISSPKRCILMYKGCTLRTYSLPSPVFYLKSASPYVNLQFTFFYTYLYYIVSVYQCIQAVYQPDFQLSKVETPFPKRILTATNPDFEFGFPVHFRHVYQCISDVYNWYTASSTSADYFQHCISTCSSTYPSIYQFWRGWTTREWRFEPLRLNEKVQRDGLKFMRTRGEFPMQ